ncbi:threonine synthase [Microbulbifer thermotolerans]|uniref:Threonine synthase n=1 Tax=Microbulbifer thermotolerans TaxID=252514 RepID=A0A143HL90_MICTH|nr:threonine synthase [Microbulbifer thermotolerans]AMX02240.1 threonine synthase [Microbulbifer thermotolerans]MCX2781948.1 threonine synthase [Microbulbifer thermotolerans]WKT61818.1 threonine synthase [Microbulbifer thermotolerans]
MKFISTRGRAPSLSFADTVLTGLASDGGLYVPESLPAFSREEIASMAGLDYRELAFRIMQPFVGSDVSEEELRGIIDRSYSTFRHSAIAPLVQTDTNEWILELFHGPTLAFKDFALQFLGQLFDLLLKKRGERVVVMGATSGDTGSAAIEGCRHCENIDIFILHPHNRVSEVQRRQMTTVLSDNVFNIALEGNFDDCQNMVKASFAEQSFLPDGRRLVAVNSINWARIMAQIVYYFYAALRLGAPQRTVNFSVPTGNFGDIFAGYLARQMGLPIGQLVIATNANDILHRCISDNDHSPRPLVHSLSPSMDIMVSSNFERLLFDLYGRDGAAVAALLADRSAPMHLSKEALDRARELFSSYRVDDTRTVEVIRAVYESSGYLLDPHTAIGVEAARQVRRAEDQPMVCLSTAHPAKFPQAVARALPTQEIPLPPHMQDLFQREERMKVLPNDLKRVHEFMAMALGG